jgi:hypothetical protein
MLDCAHELRACGFQEVCAGRQRTASPRPATRGISMLDCAHSLTPVPARGSHAVTAGPRPAARHRAGVARERRLKSPRPTARHLHAWPRTRAARPCLRVVVRQHPKPSPSREASSCLTCEKADVRPTAETRQDWSKPLSFHRCFRCACAVRRAVGKRSHRTSTGGLWETQRFAKEE